jgi:aldose 1-epimerase
MAEARPFGARIEDDPDLGAVVVLTCAPGPGRRGMEARIAPGYGSNLCRLLVDGDPVIDFDRRLLLAHDYTGTPVLYPTPNRVRDGVFTWQGREYHQVIRGRRVVEHGLVHAESWAYAEPAADRDCARLLTWIDFAEGSPLWEAFPFPHRLELEFRLAVEAMRITYTIRNRGGQAIPYGFGLHPYFTKLSGDEGTSLSVPAASVMETTPDLLPTGRLIDVAGGPFDLRRPRPLGALDLDHVFTRLEPGRVPVIEYRGLGLTIRLEASGDFGHVVVYCPKGEQFFCVENQTCSTDAHNLSARGLLAESGLQTAPAGGQASGTVTYVIA